MLRPSTPAASHDYPCACPRLGGLGIHARTHARAYIAHAHARTLTGLLRGGQRARDDRGRVGLVRAARASPTVPLAVSGSPRIQPSWRAEAESVGLARTARVSLRRQYRTIALCCDIAAACAPVCSQWAACAILHGSVRRFAVPARLSTHVSTPHRSSGALVGTGSAAEGTGYWCSLRVHRLCLPWLG